MNSSNKTIASLADEKKSSQSVILNEEKRQALTKLLHATVEKPILKDSDLKSIDQLINRKVDVNAIEKGITPLYIAVQNGHEHVLKLLIPANAQVNIHCHDVYPIYLAAQKGFGNIISLLVDAKANVNVSPRYNGVTPLYIAAQKGHEHVVALLIKAGANVKTAVDGIAPVFIASQKGHDKIVSLLIDANAEINAIFEGVTPLYIAVQKGFDKVVSKLIAAKARVDIRYKSNLTLLDVAKKHNHLSVISLLEAVSVEEKKSFPDNLLTPSVDPISAILNEIQEQKENKKKTKKKKMKNDMIPVEVDSKDLKDSKDLSAVSGGGRKLLGYLLKTNKFSTSDFALPESAISSLNRSKEIKDQKEIKHPQEMTDFALPAPAISSLSISKEIKDQEVKGSPKMRDQNELKDKKVFKELTEIKDQKDSKNLKVIIDLKEIAVQGEITNQKILEDQKEVKQSELEKKNQKSPEIEAEKRLKRSWEALVKQRKNCIDCFSQIQKLSQDLKSLNIYSFDQDVKIITDQFSPALFANDALGGKVEQCSKLSIVEKETLENEMKDLKNKLDPLEIKASELLPLMRVKKKEEIDARKAQEAKEAREAEKARKAQAAQEEKEKREAQKVLKIQVVRSVPKEKARKFVQSRSRRQAIEQKQIEQQLDEEKRKLKLEEAQILQKLREEQHQKKVRDEQKLRDQQLQKRLEEDKRQEKLREEQRQKMIEEVKQKQLDEEQRLKRLHEEKKREVKSPQEISVRNGLDASPSSLSSTNGIIQLLSHQCEGQSAIPFQVAREVQQEGKTSPHKLFPVAHNNFQIMWRQQLEQPGNVVFYGQPVVEQKASPVRKFKLSNLDVHFSLLDEEKSDLVNDLEPGAEQLVEGKVFDPMEWVPNQVEGQAGGEVEDIDEPGSSFPR